MKILDVGNVSFGHTNGAWDLHEPGGSSTATKRVEFGPDFKKAPHVVLCVNAVHGDGTVRGGGNSHAPFGFAVKAVEVSGEHFTLRVKRLSSGVPLWGINVTYIAIEK